MKIKKCTQIEGVLRCTVSRKPNHFLFFSMPKYKQPEIVWSKLNISTDHDHGKFVKSYKAAAQGTILSNIFSVNKIICGNNFD